LQKLSNSNFLKKENQMKNVLLAIVVFAIINLVIHASYKALIHESESISSKDIIVEYEWTPNEVRINGEWVPILTYVE
tara:strand:- start:70 stop:303 length:234 start_codon:yes stop_codon:yes gene_type:complete